MGKQTFGVTAAKPTDLPEAILYPIKSLLLRIVSPKDIMEPYIIYLQLLIPAYINLPLFPRQQNESLMGWQQFIL